MTISPTIHVRDKILEALSSSEAVTALVPRLYPTKTPNAPVKPFGRHGSSDADTSRPTGWRGGVVAGTYHVFVSATDAIPDPETWCGMAVDAMAEAIDALPDATVERTQVIPDGSDPDTQHGIIFFSFAALDEL